MSIFFGPEYDGEGEPRYWLGYGASRTPTYVRAPDAETAKREILHYWTADVDSNVLEPLDYYLQGLDIDNYEVQEVSEASFKRGKVKLWDGAHRYRK